MTDLMNTFEVVEAVRNGSEVSEKELRYAVRNLSIWQNGLVFTLARAVTESPMSAKTKRDLERAFKSAKEGNAVPLNKRLEGGSFEPGISQSELVDRIASISSKTAVDLRDALFGKPTPTKEG